MSDIWESLAGALLIDGGISAFTKVMNKLLSPFIIYLCKYP